MKLSPIRAQQIVTLLIAAALLVAVLWITRHTSLGTVVVGTILCVCVIGAIGSDK